MASAPSRSEDYELEDLATAARREVKRLQDQARKTSRALAQWEEGLAAHGIRLTIATEGENRDH